MEQFIVGAADDLRERERERYMQRERDMQSRACAEQGDARNMIENRCFKGLAHRMRSAAPRSATSRTAF